MGVEKQHSLDEVLQIMNDSIRKNYALTELVAQCFAAFAVSTGNKEAIVDLIKSSTSAPEMKEAHKHAQSSLLSILESIRIAPEGETNER